MGHTLIGLLMVALTALGLYWVGRNRYKCPQCGRVVRWDDVNCPHCGSDMKAQHRVGPAPSKVVEPLLESRRSGAGSRGSRHSRSRRERH